MKTPLTVLTGSVSIGFFDGMFGWGLPDGLYILTGFAILVSIGFMWYYVSKE